MLEKCTPGPASTKHDYHSIFLGPAAASVFTQTKSSSLTLLKVGTAFVLDHWTELRSYNFVSNTDVNPCKFSHFISVITQRNISSRAGTISRCDLPWAKTVFLVSGAHFQFIIPCTRCSALWLLMALRLSPDTVLVQVILLAWTLVICWCQCGS